MKTLATVLMISASMLAGAAHAELGGIYPPEADTSSHVTRAQVVADLHAAQAKGQVVLGEDVTYPDFAVTKSTKSRAQVRAELEKAIDAGQLVIGDRQFPDVLASTQSGKQS